MSSSCSSLIVLFLLVVNGSPSLLNNYIIGTPAVNCEEDNVSLDIITAKPFEGNIFVKGRARDAECKHSYHSNTSQPFSLGLGKCGMQRLRSANPRGVSFGITIIVSFHPNGFITKNDRAFHVKCFYMEPDEIVTNTIHVSSLPTYELQDEMGMPVCKYSVHLEDVDGTLLNYGNVGDTVYHVWECSGPQMGMLVKKCYVTDGDGEEHLVIDDTGCSSDSLLLEEVRYDSNKMRAHAQSQVFKYADSNQIFFTCQIRLCQLQMDMCNKITPPKCGAHKDELDTILDKIDVDSLSLDDNTTSTDFIHRPKRSIDNFLDLDVATGEMLVMDKEVQDGIEEICHSNNVMPFMLPGFVLTVVSTVFMTLMISKFVKKQKEIDSRFY
ncbi:unnamed protein product [Bursaphelenchus okinawaensis]|uniref:ZP domain-containing protein n=1 Tax=Bursaphelenchus okinawaensis TaxID=465554 RepID=A0A811JTD5_9BILA|nr:unnamed protein product [Bursaphelenchus okinawaensis]CAG9082452.1 unnamed protein product [Bursaphelenchus okinawaensis]